MMINVNELTMKKMILFAAAACVALASCVKNEITPEGESESNVLSYQAVIGKAVSRAQTDYKTNYKNVPFGSYAFFLANGKNWDTDKATAEMYINNAAISYDESGSTLQGITFAADTWHDATTVHYWPKQGSLTFFAYSPKTLPTGASLTCTKDDGIKVTGFNVDTISNTDFMVAEIAKDRTANSTTGGTTLGGDKSYYRTGVPTLFKHKLTQIGFTVKTDRDYTNDHDGTANKKYQAGDKVIKLTGITIEKVKNTGTYTQTPTESWSAQTGSVDYTHFSGNQAVTSTAVTAKNANAQTIMLPQTFSTDDQLVEITYTITTYTSENDSTTETVTETKKLKELGNWEINKNITYGITINLAGTDGSGVILWDPAVEDWTPTDNGITI